jgi:hypothetical protein
MDETPATKEDLKVLKEQIAENIYDSETGLLKEFRKWAIPIQARVTVFDSNISLPSASR